MNPIPRHDQELKAPTHYDAVMYQSHQDFRAALEKSAEVLRAAISAAQLSVASQLNREAVEQLQSNIARASEIPLKKLTVDIVAEAFTRAKQILDDLERASAADQPLGFTPQASLPALQPNMEAVPADPLTATDFFMAQATDSLNAAMDAIIQAADRPPGESRTEEIISSPTDTVVDEAVSSERLDLENLVEGNRKE